MTQVQTVLGQVSGEPPTAKHSPVGSHKHRCKKRFLRFLFLPRFLRFLTFFFILLNVFFLFFKKRALKIPLKAL